MFTAIEKAEKRFDAAGSFSFLMRNVLRAFWLRGKYIKYLFLRLFPSLRASVKEIIGKTAWGRAFSVPAGDVYGISLACFGLLTGPDMYGIKYLIKKMKETDVFYDVGANYGFYSMLAQELAGRGEIHLFEPVPQLTTYLRKNFSAPRGGEKIFLNEVAVSDVTGKSAFYESYSTAASGNSTLREDVSRGHGGAFRPVQVANITLDEYVKTHNYPTIIKMDIEGAEAMALAGAHNVLTKEHPTIMMEVWFLPLNNKEHIRAVKMLYSLGYKSFAIRADGEIKEFPDMDRYLARLQENSVGLGENFIFQ